MSTQVVRTVPPEYGRQSKNWPDTAQNPPGMHAGPSGVSVYSDTAFRQAKVWGIKELWHAQYEASYNPHPRQSVVSIEVAERRARAACALPASWKNGETVTSARIAVVSGRCEASIVPIADSESLDGGLQMKMAQRRLQSYSRKRRVEVG